MLFLFHTIAAYFSENLSTNVENPKEGDDITIKCEVVNNYGNQNVVQWFKDNEPYKITDKRFTDKKERRYELVIKDCNIYDSGSYLVNVNDRKRSLILDVKGNSQILFSKHEIKYTLERLTNYYILQFLGSNNG